MLRARLTKDLRRLDRLERDVPRKVGYAVADAALALRDDIRASWSTSSPSSPGQPPAVDSGNLDTSIIVDDTGRGTGGRFASDKDAITHFVRVDTTRGESYHGRGEYGIFLEDGTVNMAARPFFAPAVERIEAMFPGFFGDIFK